VTWQHCAVRSWRTRCGPAGRGGAVAGRPARPDLHHEFVSRYVERPGSIEEFWTELSGEPAFRDPAVVADLRLSLQLALLTLANLPLLRWLAELRRDGRVQALADLTTLDRDGWRALLVAAAEQEGEPPVPRRITGDTQEERVERYLDALVEPLMAAFPTHYLRQRVAQAPDVDMPWCASWSWPTPVSTRAGRCRRSTEWLPWVIPGGGTALPGGGGGGNGGGASSPGGGATLESLFGPMALCDCEHCRSVYSPPRTWWTCCISLTPPRQAPRPLSRCCARGGQTWRTPCSPARTPTPAALYRPGQRGAGGLRPPPVRCRRGRTRPGGAAARLRHR
jgi:hypothetical protein